MRDKILMIGGYGAVGRVIASHLAETFPGQVVVAGRSYEKANALAIYNLDFHHTIDSEKVYS